MDSYNIIKEVDSEGGMKGEDFNLNNQRLYKITVFDPYKYEHIKDLFSQFLYDEALVGF